MRGDARPMRTLRSWGPVAVVAALLLLQGFFTVRGLSQIRYEELAESVRNPFWLTRRAIYDGISSNVGWYGLHVVLYKIFGFHLFASKWMRLGIHALSLGASAFVFRKFFRGPYRYLALAIVGVSPTLLYFNTSQASYGFDLQLLPIALALLFVRDSWWARFSFGFLLMFGALCWPGFIFAIPFLLLLHHFQKRPWSAVAVGFAVPFLFFFLYLKSPLLWINDPRVHSGVFRGSGSGLLFDLDHVVGNLALLWTDLVHTGSTYYYEIAVPEWGTPVSLICGSLIAAFGIVSLFFPGPWRPWVLLGLGLTVTTLLFASLGQGNPGLRRATGAVAGFSIVALGVLLALQALSSRWRWCGICVMVLFCLSQLSKVPANARALERPSVFREGWFSDLALYPTLAKNGIVLDCSQVREASRCRYAEIYAVLSWMKVAPIYGVVPPSGEIVELRPELWESYRLGH